MPQKLVKIESILIDIKKNNNGIYSRIPKPIIILNKNISHIIGDSIIHISEFVLAKVKGMISELNYHPEITDNILISLPLLIQSPIRILKDIFWDLKKLVNRFMVV